MAQDLVGFQSRVALKDNQPSSLSPIGGFRGTAKFVGLHELIFIFYTSKETRLKSGVLLINPYVDRLRF